MEIEEQHPIPQQVSSYQFKLVGDMTLQQFFYVAGGALVALLFYSSGLPSYVKWPIILFSFLLGIALAFFPLEDRPLAKWIILFIKAIYSPTLYVWKQTSIKFSYFQAESTIPAQPAVQTQPVQQTGKSFSQETTKLENEERKFLEKVGADLGGSVASIPQDKPVEPSPQTTKSQVHVPETKKVTVQAQEKTQVQAKPETGKPAAKPQGFRPTPSAGVKGLNVQSARFSPEAAPPLPPTKANVVVGQVVDTKGKIVENAILEIRDSEGRPARALRSNKLGHFMIVTPLVDGDYEITTEKEGFVFDTISLKARGEIIPPLAVWAKEITQNQQAEAIKV